MLECVLFFKWQLVVLGAFALVYYLFLFVYGRKNKEKMKSISWVYGNKRRGIFFLLLARVVGAPISEELIFRAPLVILFKDINFQSWIFITVSATLFSLIHLKNPSMVVPEKIYHKHKNGELETDDLISEKKKISKELNQEDKKKEMIMKIVQVLFTFVLGIFAGYWGIKTQSLWTPVLIHAAANLLGPVVIILLAIILQYVVLAASALWYEIEWRLFLK